MNLIERLGGYEAAKEYLANLEKIPMHEQTEDTLYWLPDMLLQYRRQHNIFEVGNRVVFLSNIAPEHDGIYTITEVFKNSCFIIEDGMDYRAFYDYIRHASPEEIKAGKRL